MLPLRYALRTLGANRAFTLTAILSLALGIGANTAIFSIVNAVMLRTLPVEDPHRLVEVRGTFTNPIWEQIRDHGRQGFSGMLAYSGDRFDLTAGGEVQFAQGIWVSGDFFRVLGVPALRGRVLTAEDDRRGGGKSGPVAVISYKFWQSHYAGDPAAIGKTIRLDRRAFEIAGITPPWFTGLDVDTGFDVAIPIGCEPLMHTDESALDHRSWWWLHILGRLAPGITLQQASGRLKAVAPEIYRATVPQQWEARDQQEYLRRSFDLRTAATGFSETGQQYRTALFALMALVGLVLLVACANIANLLLARGAARAREISIRLAIGASRARIAGQFLLESLLLSFAGAAVGLLFALWAGRLLVMLISSGGTEPEFDVSPDLRVLAFTAGVALLTGVLFGVAPAWRATRVEPAETLRDTARGLTSRRFPLARLLVAGQVSLSLVLLAGAGLFLGTMRNLLSVALGFDRHNVLLVRADTQARIPKSQRNTLYRDILDRLRRAPGVLSASSSMVTPIGGGVWNDLLYPEGYTPKAREDTLTYMNRVSPGYFRTLGTPLLMGRDFDDRDTAAAQRIMILGESAARQFFGNASPLGKTVRMDAFGKPGSREGYEVIGVAKDVKYENLREDTLRTAYLVSSQDPEPFPRIFYEVRSALPPAALTPALRTAIADVNRDISIEFHTLEKQVGDSLAREKAVAVLASFFGGLGLLLAMVGLYGVTAYTVARRRAEIGIRVALGAQRGSVIWLVLRGVALTLAAGAVAGAAAAGASARLVASLLYGMRPADPATLAAAAGLLLAAGLLAGLLPALRAARMEPVAALRLD